MARLVVLDPNSPIGYSISDEYKEYADTLDIMQAAENDGRGITCVRSIVFFLRQGDWESALAVRQNDGDKIVSYPKVEAAARSIFGCRLHAALMCSSWICNGTGPK